MNRTPHRVALVVTVLLVVVTSATAVSVDPVVPPTLHKKMEGVAERIARGGRTDDVIAFIDVMLALDYPMPAAAALVSKCNGNLAKAKKVRAKLPSEARSVAAIASELGALLDGLDDEERERVARQVVTLDVTVDAGQLALGRERIGNAWRPAGAVLRQERRETIRQALAGARKLSIDVTVAPCTDPYAKAVCGARALTATIGPVRIHRACSEQKLRRISTETFRALAVANFLLVGELEVPWMPESEWVTVESQREFRRGLDLALERRLIKKEWYDLHRDLSGCVFSPKQSLQYDRLESGVEATLFSYLCGKALYGSQTRFTLHKAQPCLHVALQNWVCLGYLGTTMPIWAWFEKRALPFAGTFSGLLDEARRREYEEMLRMSEAGIVGYRSWLQYLTRNGQDAKFRHAMKDELGQVANELLLKSTFVFEYLLEQGDVFTLMQRTSPKWEPNVGKGAAELFERELGAPLHEFEARWRDWLLPDDAGIAQRLAGDAAAAFAPSKTQREALAHLNAVRRAALARELVTKYHDVTLDEDLSDGARRHALYLDRNPAQKAQWPEAHEEFPDHEGYTVEGARAAANSVIAPGVRGATEAIDAWMATFYHRLPLIEPNLIRIGFALERGTAVCDSGSLVGPFHVDIPIVCPYDGERNVPLSFAPELPNPVPGEEQSAWGYPITVQLPPAEGVDASEPEFVLRRGGANGDEVECHVSTPQRPTNPDLAPQSAYCLIPKRTLDRNTTYHVTFTPANRSYAKRWSFMTGR